MPVLGKLAPIVRYIYRTIATHISVLSTVPYGKLVADSPIIPHLVPLTVCWTSWVSYQLPGRLILPCNANPNTLPPISGCAGSAKRVAVHTESIDLLCPDSARCREVRHRVASATLTIN